MKQGGQAVLIGTVLLILAALVSTNRKGTSGDHGTSKGACCPLIQSLNTMAPPVETNGGPPTAIITTQAVTNPL